MCVGLASAVKLSYCSKLPGEFGARFGPRGRTSFAVSERHKCLAVLVDDE